MTATVSHVTHSHLYVHAHARVNTVIYLRATIHRVAMLPVQRTCLAPWPAYFVCCVSVYWPHGDTTPHVFSECDTEDT